MMHKRLNRVVNRITQKKRFIVEINLYVHPCKDTRPIRAEWNNEYRSADVDESSVDFESCVNRYLRRMTNEKAIAERLLQINAIKLSLNQPFTWASGWKSPIYCDNRRVLSFPFARDHIKSELCNLVFEKFADAELLAGVATAGIAWGAMVSDQLKLPYIYVRPKPKEHGLGNQVEGYFEKGQKAVVIEDLVSTGTSSLQVVNVLRSFGVEVIGMVSIFSYDFPAAAAAISGAGLEYQPLTTYPVLIELAVEKGLVSPGQQEILLKWRNDPANWDGVL